MFNQLALSIPLFRFRRIDVRADWTLLLIVIMDIVLFLRAGEPWWFAIAAVTVLFTSILLHEFGHSFAARAVGGDSNRIVLWMMGGLAECRVPPRPGANFLVSGAGPLVTGTLAGVAFGVLAIFAAYSTPLPHAITLVVGYLGLVNLRMLLFNLIPCHPLDGGGMFNATMWAMFGASRAQRISLWVSYPCVVGVLIWAFWVDNSLAIFLGIWLLMMVITEHGRLRSGDSQAFGMDGWTSHPARAGWFARWRERRRQLADDRIAKAESAEQEILDRLLAKVSEHGLPSLTTGERAQLDHIAKHQRARDHVR